MRMGALRSLRFKLPALFVVGVLIAALVTALVAIRLFQDYTRDQTLRTLRRQAQGLSQLYAAQALQAIASGGDAPTFAAANLEKATGARLYYIGLSVFPGDVSGLRQIDRSVVDIDRIQAGRNDTFEFVPTGETRTFLAVANPLKLSGQTFGAIVVARPTTQLQARFLGLVKRMSVAMLIGLAAAGLLAWWLSRRVTKPLLALSKAADEVAERRYDVELPRVPKGDEIGHLAERFGEMTERLAESEAHERNFLMSVSHELRTPLTAIRGHVEALREGLADDPEVRDLSLSVIQAESERLTRLVGDILDLAKLDAHRFTLVEEEVDLGHLLELAYLGFAEEARRRGIDFERSLDGAPVIHSDGDRVLQVVTNVLKNAFEWTPDGGRIVLGLARANGSVSVAVEDSGPGIAVDEQESIFRPFVSGNASSGTGLGLPIARELASALGGRLELTSQPGQGSTFRLTLPATRGAPAR